jgi:hypothetical protein
VDDEGKRRLQLVKWSPVKNSLAFVSRNNIFYKSEAESTTVIKITTDGLPYTLYNGVPDWVYEGTPINSIIFTYYLKL